MTRYPRLMPADPKLFTAHVVATRRTSPSFQRVTIAGADLAAFEWSGNDHWFRLFLPPAGSPLVLPAVSGRAWYKRYLEIGEQERPHCSNYTVADFRPVGGGAREFGRSALPGSALPGSALPGSALPESALPEMDIDVVLHWDEAGEIAGRVAIWATSATPGSAIALLDQGPLFDPPADVGAVHLICDETGLPAVRGILRSLDERMIGTAIIEVPLEADIEPLAAPPGVEVQWVARTGDPGRAALDALAETTSTSAPEPNDYAFVVGESALATEGRRALHRAGLAKSRITFSGYWKRSVHN
ncbi:siderophore-interacting protein [Subtercola endophyticus]|uniref:siderophore-interacting protein n=1 Tax=Subtercola endophyticus TaxID=2895559 RepID=UPI001E628BB9|nr:siderophore-interacting protein [Subtercola endophyticus]UFS57499.1 siderophore-interacting protein [Subtercola endophyticus]